MHMKKNIHTHIHTYTYLYMCVCVYLKYILKEICSLSTTIYLFFLGYWPLTVQQLGQPHYVLSSFSFTETFFAQTEKEALFLAFLSFQC